MQEQINKLTEENAQLRAELEAIGAGGVESLRKPQCLLQIQEPSAVAVPDERETFKAYIKTRPNYFDGMLANGKYANGFKVIDIDNQWTGWKARAALAATPKSNAGIPASNEPAPVVLPEPVAYLHPKGTCATTDLWYKESGWLPLYTEQQVRALLAGVSAPAAPTLTEEALADKIRSHGVYGGFAAHLMPFIAQHAAPQAQADARDAQEEQHPDDAAVDALAARMKAKLAKQRDKGYGGWDTDCTRARLSELLRGHVDKGDPVDVANYCAFLAARGEGIAPLAKPSGWKAANEGIGEALQRACMDLPAGYEVVISLEKDAGTVHWFDQDGNEHVIHDDGSFADTINAATAAAIAAAKEEGGA